jgi:hypothetical protein
LRILIAGMLMLLLLGLIGTDAASASAPPASTDVMFVFDTSGSMTSELAEAKEKIQSVMASLSATLPNVAFGVSRVEDVPDWEGESFAGSEPTEAELIANKEKAWELVQPISTEQAASIAAINKLEIYDGGDAPEAYGRALWEADTNPGVGWRAGARHEIVLIADNVPHGKNLDEGLPESEWLSNPFDTGAETPAKDGIPGTQWTPGTDLAITAVAKQLASDGKPLESVEFFGGEDGYLHYWEYWAGLSGGSALNGSSGELASKLTSLIEGGACGATCPHPTTTQVVCSLVVATASDTCTATVADTDPTGSTVPTGAVGFASASGGSFPSGNSCTLVATPASPNTSSCSVEYLPPTKPSSAPAITATYAGDAGHTSSQGKTTYPAAEELGKDIDASELGEYSETGVELPIECGFPCLVSGELFTMPSLASLSSVRAATLETTASAAKHKKKKKPVLLGKGTFKLAKAGKGKLVIHFNSKARHAFAHLKGKVHLTIKYTIKTLSGTLVETKTEHVTLKLKKKKKKKH